MASSKLFIFLCICLCIVVFPGHCQSDGDEAVESMNPEASLGDFKDVEELTEEKATLRGSSIKEGTEVLTEKLEEHVEDMNEGEKEQEGINIFKVFKKILTGDTGTKKPSTSTPEEPTSTPPTSTPPTSTPPTSSPTDVCLDCETGNCRNRCNDCVVSNCSGELCEECVTDLCDPEPQNNNCDEKCSFCTAR